LSTGHTDELEYIAPLMNNPLGLSRASLHDTNPQTQLLSALGTLKQEHILLILIHQNFTYKTRFTVKMQANGKC